MVERLITYLRIERYSDGTMNLAWHIDFHSKAYFSPVTASWIGTFGTRLDGPQRVTKRDEPMKAAKEIKTGRPPGRPRKFVARFHVTVRITPQLYADIQEKADASRRSISEEVEARLERLAVYDSALAAMGTSQPAERLMTKRQHQEFRRRLAGMRP